MIEYKKMIVVDKVLKITLCIMLVFIFTIMKPKQEAEAAVPILGWVAGVLGGLVIDVAISQGITFANKNAEKDFKNKVVNNLWNAYGDRIAELKPSKLDAVKWVFKAPKWLMAVTVDAVADAIEQIKSKGIEKEKYMSEWGGGTSSGGGAGRKFGPSNDLPEHEFREIPVSDPYYKTDLVITMKVPTPQTTPSRVEAYNYFVKYATIKVVPNPFAQSNKVRVCLTNNDSQCIIFTSDKPYLLIYPMSLTTFGYKISDSPVDVLSDVGFLTPASSANYRLMNDAWTAYKQMLAQQGTTIITFEDMIVTDKPRVVLNIPDGFKDIEKLEKLPLPPVYENKIIEFEMPDIIKPQFDLIPVGSEFEWDLVNNYIVEQGDNFYKVEYNIDYKPVINNYYALPPALIEEVEKDWDVVPVDKDKPNELDGSFNQYIKNFYNYFADGIITSIDGFKQLNSSVNSIFSVFGNYFTFLPIEFRTLFFSGASMSVLLGVLYWGRR